VWKLILDHLNPKVTGSIFGPQFLDGLEEQKMKRRVPSVYHGLSGTKRERPISKGFIHFKMVRAFTENITRMSLKLLAIPAEVTSRLKLKT
jgi:hypothetical protein